MTQSDIKAATGSSWSKLAPYAGRGWVRCLALIFFGIGVHIPSLTGELLWDDIVLVNDNPLIKSPALILEAFRHYLFPDAYTGHYRPVQTISYTFDYLFWNKEAYGYHLSNVLWHVLSGILLYYLLRRILGSFVERWPDKSFLKDASIHRPRHSFWLFSGSSIPCTAPQSTTFPAAQTVWLFSSGAAVGFSIFEHGISPLRGLAEACLFWRCCPPCFRFVRARAARSGS